MGRRRGDAARRGLPVVATVVACAVAVHVATPGAAATTGDLESARDELAEGEAELDRLLADVAAAEEGLAVTRDRLALAAADAAASRVALDEAVAVAAAASRRLAEASAARQRADLDHARARDDVDARAAELWMRGSATDNAVAASLLRADDLHDVTVRWYALGRAADLDRDRLVAAASTLQDVVDVAEVERGARQEAERATAEAARVRRVADRRAADAQAALADAEAAQARREAAITELEDDLEARRALVRRLSTIAPELGDVAEWLAARGDVPLDGPPPGWADRLPAAGVAWAPAIVHAASRAGIDPRLLAALVWTESGFRPNAVSSAGAIGLAQLMPPTARELGVDPRDPVANLRGGARYLRQQMDAFGTLELALAAYNAGPGAVQRAGPAVPDFVETQVYVVRVADRLSRLGG